MVTESIEFWNSRKETIKSIPRHEWKIVYLSSFYDNTFFHNDETTSQIKSIRRHGWKKDNPSVSFFNDEAIANK